MTNKQKIPRGMTNLATISGTPLLVKTSDVKLADKFADEVKKVVMAATPFVRDASDVWRFYGPPLEHHNGTWLFHFRMDIHNGRNIEGYFYVGKDKVRSMNQKEICKLGCEVTRQVISKAIIEHISAMEQSGRCADEKLREISMRVEQLRSWTMWSN